MKEILSQLVWFMITSTILILIFSANNIEKWLSKPVTEIKIADIIIMSLYILSFIFIFYDNTKKITLYLQHTSKQLCLICTFMFIF